MSERFLKAVEKRLAEEPKEETSPATPPTIPAPSEKVKIPNEPAQALKEEIRSQLSGSKNKYECDDCGREFVTKPARCPGCGGHKIKYIDSDDSRMSASDNAAFDVHQTDPARLKGKL